jgi:hypothetical protein
MLRYFRLLALMFLGFTLLLGQRGSAAPTDTLIYGDNLASGWANWSWDSTLNFTNSSPVHSGTHSISAALNPWAGLSLHYDGVLVPGSDNLLSFWIHGGTTNGRTLRVYLQDSNGAGLPHVMLNDYVQGGAVAVNEWREVRIPLSTLLAGSAGWTRLTIQEGTGTAQPTFFVDDIRLVQDGSLPTPTPTATAAPATITVDGTTLRPLPEELRGTNVAVWNADERLNRADVRARLRAAQPTLLRFPGGSTSDEYHWKEHQPPFGPDDWQFNTEAFVALADEVGAERMITANFGSGTAQEAADWVRFTNVTNDWNVEYWEIGNEIYGDWETSWTHDPRAYVEGDATHDGFNDFCHAMKAVDPTIKIGLIGVTNRTEYNGWLNTVLTYADPDCTDFLSLHRYPLAPGNVDTTALLADPPAAWPTIFTNVRAAMNEHFGRELPIFVTEYNSYYTEPSAPAVQAVNLLFLADTLGQFAVNGAAGANHWDVMNNRTSNGGDYGILLIDQEFRRQPSYYLFPLWAKMGDQLLAASSNTSSVRVYATRYGEEGDLAIMVINQGAAREVTLRLENVVPGSSSMQAWQAVGDGLNDTDVTWNGQPNPPDDLSLVPPLSLPVSGTTTQLTLPGTSVTVLRIATTPPLGVPTETVTPEPTETATPEPTVTPTGPARLRLYLPLIRAR